MAGPTFPCPLPHLPRLEILTPVRMQIGAGFVGDLDEVRISNVARSADWVKLQYENQKPLQTLVGPLVQPGSAFVGLRETGRRSAGRQSATVTARAGGAEKVYWIIRARRRKPLPPWTGSISRSMPAG